MPPALKRGFMDSIDYEVLVQRALYQVVHRALEAVQKFGTVGQHYFLVTFSTKHPGVDVPVDLLEEFPEEMTIILQHEFWDLSVTEYGFSVGLCFGEVDETIFVPFEALIEFKDPHSQFCLEFTPIDFLAEDEPEQIETSTEAKKSESSPDNIVSLDQFRKK